MGKPIDMREMIHSEFLKLMKGVEPAVSRRPVGASTRQVLSERTLL